MSRSPHRSRSAAGEPTRVVLATPLSPHVRRLGCVVAQVLVLTLAFAGVARADADPASDTLYVTDVFLPLSVRVPPELGLRLQEVTHAARAAGHPVKVAVIATPRDLGGVPSIFGRPTYYARFLAAELQYLYSGTLLVVMPQGAGLARAGRLVADADVVHAKIEPGADGLTRTAIRLVRALTDSAESGSRARTPSSAAGGGGLPLWGWIAIVLAAAGALASIGLVLLRARLRGRWLVRKPAPSTAAPGGAEPRRKSP